MKLLLKKTTKNSNLNVNNNKKDFVIDDIRWCYQTILGREPESERVLIEKFEHHDNFKSLVRDFLKSSEFLSARKENLITRKNTLSLLPLIIEYTTSVDDLKKVSDRIKSSWTKMGYEAPHFSVLTNQDYLPEKINQVDNKTRFWKSGVTEADYLVHTLSRFGIKDTKTSTCVEYGCGVGRVTHGLANHFAKVVGYDISESHLKVARIDAQKNELFELIKSPTEISIFPCDVFYSKIVLQHNPPPLIARIIECAFDALKINGIAVFQVPTYANGYSFNVRDYLSKPSKDEMEMHCLPQQVIFDMARKRNVQVLEVLEDNFTGASNKFISNTFIFRKMASE